MLIVSGWLRVAADEREAFITESCDAAMLARQRPGCHDFVVAADPLDPERVIVYERWENEAALIDFRGDGPSDEVAVRILAADVHQYNVKDD